MNRPRRLRSQGTVDPTKRHPELEASAARAVAAGEQYKRLQAVALIAIVGLLIGMVGLGAFLVIRTSELANSNHRLLEQRNADSLRSQSVLRQALADLENNQRLTQIELQSLYDALANHVPLVFPPVPSYSQQLSLTPVPSPAPTAAAQNRPTVRQQSQSAPVPVTRAAPAPAHPPSPNPLPNPPPPPPNPPVRSPSPPPVVLPPVPPLPPLPVPSPHPKPGPAIVVCVTLPPVPSVSPICLQL